MGMFHIAMIALESQTQISITAQNVGWVLFLSIISDLLKFKCLFFFIIHLVLSYFQSLPNKNTVQCSGKHFLSYRKLIIVRLKLCSTGIGVQVFLAEMFTLSLLFGSIGFKQVV